MNMNRDEALRAKDIAESLMKKPDFSAARTFAMKAHRMDSSLENISHMLMVCDVHCAATEKLFGNEMDWYGILQVELNANDIIIKKQYKRLALLLHPDKNKLPGAEAAFKLIGEAQRILLDKEKRTMHDMKRKSWRKPAPAPSYKGPSYHTQPLSRESVNMRNVFSELRPKNRHPQQKAQGQPAAFGYCPTFWTTCPSCQTKYEYRREHIMAQFTCQACKKRFTALETPFQSVPLANDSRRPTSYVPQQDKFPSQKACNEPHKRPDNPATVSSGKTGSTAGNNNGKRKRKNMVESSESSDSESSSESEDVVNGDNRAAQDLGSDGGQQPRRSVRGKREVSYKENLSDDDDDVDLVDDNGEGSQINTDTEGKEETEDEKQTHHKDHHSTETLPNGVKPKEKIKENQVETTAGASDPQEDSGSEAEPNIINCDDPEFSDFDKQREESCFKVGQIWALYDEGEGMPRFYALIKKVTTPNFLINYVWLEAEEDETHNLTVSVGKFELGGEEVTDVRDVFSHLVHSKTRSGGRHFKVFPRRGETWALYKNWNMDSESTREYEFVEILSDHAEGATLSVGFLSKVEGFLCVFRPLPNDDGSNTCEIPPHEFCRFSHGIPSFRLKGTEGIGVIEGWYELDPAALPVPGSQNISGEEEAAQNQDHQSPTSSGSAS
uniref:Chaperone protein DnaJ n=1 Tax=Noccaea caerulescens TaxID=107243 RepID=A0A1J3IZ92_NOCCA